MARGRGGRPNAHERRKIARTAVWSNYHCGGNGSRPSPVEQQPRPQDDVPKSGAQDEGNAEAQEITKEETPEPMVMDRDFEDITQQATEPELDAIEAEKDGPITMLRLSNDITVLAKHNRKLARENSALRQGLEKEVEARAAEAEARAEHSKQVTQELKVCALGIRLLAKRLGQDPDEASI